MSDIKMNDKADLKKSAGNEPEEQIQIPLADLIKTRVDKSKELKQLGIDPYPASYKRDHLVRDILSDFDTFVSKETVVRIAGRIRLKRKMGKVFFADLYDSSGRIQLYIKINNVGQECFDLFNSVDLGDIVGCEGTLFVTRTGENTLSATSVTMLAKALHPLPDKHSGLADKEIKYRRRYVDLIMNEEVRDTFRLRTKMISLIRNYLNNLDFLEVETPVLQPLYGGGNAKPFETHHNRLDMKMYLRIADELYLKRLIVGGYDKVWEFCKDFRNEGMDRLHNPEFSMIELYWAFADYNDMALMFEDMLRHLVFEMHGTYKIAYGDHEIDFEPKFKSISMIDSIKEATGLEMMDMSFEDAKAAAVDMGIEDDVLINWGKTVEAIWEKKVEPNLIQPTFIIDHPVEISPLAKRHSDNERLTERFELFIGGGEMGNAFSELNDPIDQLKRFLQQGKAMEAGDDEAQPLDDDFITAL